MVKAGGDGQWYRRAWCRSAGGLQLAPRRGRFWHWAVSQAVSQPEQSAGTSLSIDSRFHPPPTAPAVTRSLGPGVLEMRMASKRRWQHQRLGLERFFGP